MEKIQAYRAKDGSLYHTEREANIKDTSIDLRSFFIHKSTLFEFSDNGLINPTVAIDAFTKAIVLHKKEFLELIENL